MICPKTNKTCEAVGCTGRYCHLSGPATYDTVIEKTTNMKASDLRIGNWVIDENENYTQVVSIIHRPSQMQPYILILNSHRSQMGIRVDMAKPIPLTAELLTKCGFKDYHFSYSDNCILLQSGVISKEDNRYFVYSGLGGADSYGFEVKLEYLHQLQNLYHALIGEELPVNL